MYPSTPVHLPYPRFGTKVPTTQKWETKYQRPKNGKPPLLRYLPLGASRTKPTSTLSPNSNNPLANKRHPPPQIYNQIHPDRTYPSSRSPTCMQRRAGLTPGRQASSRHLPTPQQHHTHPSRSSQHPSSNKQASKQACIQQQRRRQQQQCDPEEPCTDYAPAG